MPSAIKVEKKPGFNGYFVFLSYKKPINGLLTQIIIFYQYKGLKKGRIIRVNKETKRVQNSQSF